MTHDERLLLLEAVAAKHNDALDKLIIEARLNLDATVKLQNSLVQLAQQHAAERDEDRREWQEYLKKYSEEEKERSKDQWERINMLIRIMDDMIRERRNGEKGGKP
jgi:hypothetical protein